MKFINALTELEKYFEQQQFENSHLELYQPIAYIMSLKAKRFRPALLLMAHDLYSDQPELALPAAYGLELFHNFTLLHDDIMDEALIRRSEPAAHIKFGINMAILSGDAMMMLTYQYLLKSVTKDNVMNIMHLMTETAIEICEGQSLDMQFESKAEVTVEEYLEMIKLKTAVLLGAALKIGGIIGSAPDADLQNLYDCGVNLGVAFQIQDDVLDTFGAQSKVGKEIGGDIRQKKKTFLIAKAVEVLSNEDSLLIRERFDPNYKMESTDVQLVVELLRKNNIDQNARELQDIYYNKAMSNLENITTPNSAKEHLKEVASSLFQRSH